MGQAPDTNILSIQMLFCSVCKAELGEVTTVEEDKGDRTNTRGDVFERKYVLEVGMRIDSECESCCSTTIYIYKDDKWVLEPD